MSVTAIVGMQWGDEGKGKVVDFLVKDADVVLRYQGGSNAGHTVVLNGKKYIFHLLPSGMLYADKVCIIGDGVVVDLPLLVEEYSALKKEVKDVGDLKISELAHLVMPYHKLIDELEEGRRGSQKIGTTKRGIGPAYADKAERTGIRIGDILRPALFEEKLRRVLDRKNEIIAKIYGGTPLNFKEIRDLYLGYTDFLKDKVCNTVYLLRSLIDEGKSILLEGAQGTLLDITYGTYPYVTSSHPISGGACIGAGISPKDIDEVIGVLKAYTTRVGMGPFPTEMEDPLGSLIREKGGEFGATTGRPRRCGWLDGVMMRYSVKINGIDRIALTKLDVLSGLEKVKVCVAYKVGGKLTEEFTPFLDDVSPVYEELDGWSGDISKAKSFDELPSEAKRYIEFIEEISGCKVFFIGVGPGREEVILR
ncbi:MAG: adenylosuccinate synthase [Synergistetes bacterium]|nr:MAG: Adenylosuccinate synthetase [bacterium 42_11]MBC7331642.1 adenylosuccinate synthase [Synergistota bacterium]MDK2870785.1 adenylosuccinate synthase [bacterium]